MIDVLNKIESSFKLALKGQESPSTLIRNWGVIAYLIAYFVVNKIIRVNQYRFIVVTLAMVMVCYFIWHIYVLVKCSPKKPKLSKEEKAKIREEGRKDYTKSFMRKLFLQEPVTEWNPLFITIVIDTFCVAHFLNYIAR